MKRTYLHKSNIGPRRRARFLAGGAILFLAMVVFYINAPTVLPNVAYKIALPFWSVRMWTTDRWHELVGYVSSKAALIEENDNLKGELQIAQEKLLRTQSFENEIEALTGLRVSDTKRDLIVDVLSRPPVSPYDTLVLDGGAARSVTVGDTVLSPGRVAMGEITEVFRDFSRATLFSSPGREVSVRIGTHGVQARSHGVGGGAFEVLLPREIEVEKGETVEVTGVTPPILGVIQSIENRPVDFLQLVRFASPVNIYQLRYVIVSRGHLVENTQPENNATTTRR